MKKKEMLMVNKHFDLLRKSLGWILKNVNSEGIAQNEFSPLICHLENVFKTRGLRGGIAYSKAVRTGVMNYLSGNPLRPEGVRSSTDGLPICLGPLMQYYRGSQPQLMLRLVNTILFASRALKLEASPDISSITEPSNRRISEFQPIFVSDF
jgi:hypothetical protein